MSPIHLLPNRWCAYFAAIFITCCPAAAAASEQPPILLPSEISDHHGVHWESLTEWWYFVGHLQSTSGRKFGYQLSFFKFSVIGFFAHIAITDDEGKSHSFVRKYYLPTEVSLSQEKLSLQYGENLAQSSGDHSFTISGQVDRGQFDLMLGAQKPPLLVNGTGVIAMPQGGDSYYYSLTQLTTEGSLYWDGESYEVKGKSWMDHQWGEFTSLVSGWDWFSIQMNDGNEYNIYSFRNSDDSIMRQHIGISRPNGSSVVANRAELKRLNWWKSPSTGNYYVTKWEIYLPDAGDRFVVEATVPDQEIFSQSLFDVAPTYWEGRCTVRRENSGVVTSGVSYAEHFPYLKKIP